MSGVLDEFHHKRRAIVDAKYIEPGAGGLVFELADGQRMRRVISQEHSGLVENSWWTLIRSGSEWMVAGVAASAPAGTVPGGSL